jgi:hypothetical protein
MGMLDESLLLLRYCQALGAGRILLRSTAVAEGRQPAWNAMGDRPLPR